MNYIVRSENPDKSRMQRTHVFKMERKKIKIISQSFTEKDILRVKDKSILVYKGELYS